MKWLKAAVIVGMAIGTSTGVAKADSPFAVDLSLGYSRLEMDGRNSRALDQADGSAARITFMTPAPDAAGFRFGFGITGSGYRDEFRVVDDDGDRERRFRELDLLIPELRIAYHVPIQDFFIEPAFGVGLAIGDYRTGRIHRHRDFDDDDFDDNDRERDTDDIFRVNVALRPSIKIGYGRGHWATGVEAAYLWTHLHFDEGIGGDISEAYVGGFFRWSF